jgi:uncharacterized small protein (TIGR04563 family)
MIGRLDDDAAQVQHARPAVADLDGVFRDGPNAHDAKVECQWCDGDVWDKVGEGLVAFTAADDDSSHKYGGEGACQWFDGHRGKCATAEHVAAGLRQCRHLSYCYLPTQQLETSLENHMASADKRKQSLYFPEEMLKEIQDEANRQDRSLSWIVQQAWRISRGEIKKFPSVNDVIDGGERDDIRGRDD